MRWAMRIFGGMNIIATFLSLYYFAGMIEIHWRNWPGKPNHQEWAVFCAISSVSTLLVFYLAYLGVRLIKQDYEALWKVCLVLAAEMAICLADFVVTWLATPASISKDVLWFWGIAISPLSLQVYFGYTLVGLATAIVLIFVARRSSGALSTQAS